MSGVALPPLPDGLAARRPDLADLERAVDFFNACDVPLIGCAWHTVDELRSIWTHPEFDLDADAVLVEDAKGRIVGYEQVLSEAPFVKHRLYGRTSPRVPAGVDAKLLSWGEARARERLEDAAPGVRVVAHGWCVAADDAYRALLGRFGYALARHTLHMRIDFDDAPLPAARWPAGIELRPYAPSRMREVFLAWKEASRDHFGHAATDDDTAFARFEHWATTLPDFDPGLWLVAWDGDAIAGVCLCQLRDDEDPTLGWVDELGVRRPWRRRGLATALLLQSFAELQARGQRGAGLAVDAESLTGATKLYAQAGMRIHRTIESYEKLLRDGRDVATRAVDG